jgi:hypothetical protein
MTSHRNEEGTPDKRFEQHILLEKMVQGAKHMNIELLPTLCNDDLYPPIMAICKSDTVKLMPSNLKISPFHCNERDRLPSNRCCDIISISSVSLHTSS